MVQNIKIVDFKQEKQIKNIENTNKVLKRLIEIYDNHIGRAYLEQHLIADYVELDIETTKDILNKLCRENILEENIEYICNTCRCTTILSTKLFEEYSENCYTKNCFLCDECEHEISKNDTTGFIYYHILDIKRLKEKFK